MCITPYPNVSFHVYKKNAYINFIINDSYPHNGISLYNTRYVSSFSTDGKINFDE